MTYPLLRSAGDSPCFPFLTGRYLSLWLLRLWKCGQRAEARCPGSHKESVVHISTGDRGPQGRARRAPFLLGGTFKRKGVDLSSLVKRRGQEDREGSERRTIAFRRPRPERPRWPTSGRPPKRGQENKGLEAQTSRHPPSPTLISRKMMCRQRDSLHRRAPFYLALQMASNQSTTTYTLRRHGISDILAPAITKRGQRPRPLPQTISGLPVVKVRENEKWKANFI
jgi:hypothetical protein